MQRMFLSILVNAYPDPSCLTFMGRLANEIVNLTNPKTTIFLPARQAWYDTKTQGKQNCFFSLLKVASFYNN